MPLLIEFLTPNGKKNFNGRRSEFLIRLDTGVVDQDGWIWLAPNVYAWREEESSYDEVYEDLAK